MADHNQLDELLRDAMHRASQQSGAMPGELSGVAEAIRQRVAAGDLGTPAAASIAPGWASGSGWAWMPWVAVVVAGGVVGAGLGFSGLFGGPTEQVLVVGHNSVLDQSASAAACPGGAVVDTIPAGTRVLAVERSADGTSLGVRNPHDFSDVLWLATGDLMMDAGQDPAALPVGDECPTVIVAEPERSDPAEEPEQPDSSDPQPPANPQQPANPQPPSNPQPPEPEPGDTTPPSIQQHGASAAIIYNLEPVTIFAVAGDDVGVTGVTVTWSGQYSGSSPMSVSGGQWVYTFVPPTTDSGTITFTIRARDAAGNLSVARTVVVDHQFFG